jgi:hypothetical protein
VPTAEHVITRPQVSRRKQWRRVLTGGGPDGNERLTSLVGAILIVLLAVLGITILRIHQLIWLHLFLGLVLLGPITAKTASTGYRFIRYYTGDSAYRSKGPPAPLLRATAPLVVASTIVVFASGIVLLLAGPRGRQPFVAVHKVSFVLWLAFTGIHVLGHLEELVRSLRSAGTDGELRWESPGSAGRSIALIGALVGGVVLAIALIPDFATWTANGAFLHHHG